MNQIKTQRKRYGLTLVELLMALSITVIVGAGVVAMTESVAIALEQGRTERERTVASAVAAARLSAVTAPASCALEIEDGYTVLWRGDSRRDGRVQASEVDWLRFDEANGSIVHEWVSFPESFSAHERAQADRTCSTNENYESLRTDYDARGFLARVLLLDGLASTEGALPSIELENPRTARRLVWRLAWRGDVGVDATTVVTGAFHLHQQPENES